MNGCYGLISTEIIIDPIPINLAVILPFAEKYQYVAFKTDNPERVSFHYKEYAVICLFIG